MTDERINEQKLWAECRALALEIFEQAQEEHGKDADPDTFRDEMDDCAHEYADGHQWVIYTYKAIQLCSECDTTRGEEMLDDLGGVREGQTFGGIASMIAYGEVRQRIAEGLQDLIEAWEPAEDEEEAEA